MQMPLRIAGSQKEKQYRSLNFCNCSTTVLHHAFVFSLELYYKRISVPKRRDLQKQTRSNQHAQKIRKLCLLQSDLLSILQISMAFPEITIGGNTMQATLNECFKTAPHVSFIKKIYYNHMKKYKPLVPYTIDVWLYLEFRQYSRKNLNILISYRTNARFLISSLSFVWFEQLL